MPPVYWEPLLVQSVSAVNANDPTLDIDAKLGDLLIASCSSDQGANFGVLSGWTLVENRQTSGNIVSGSLYYKVAQDEVETVTANFATGSNNSLVVWQLRGLDTTPHAYVGTTSAFATSHDFGDLNVSASEMYVLAIVNAHNGITDQVFSSGTLSFTKAFPVTGSNQRLLGMSDDVASIATHSALASWTTGRTSVGWLIAFPRLFRGDSVLTRVDARYEVYKPDKVTPEPAAGDLGGSFPVQGTTEPTKIWDARGQTWFKSSLVLPQYAPVNFRYPSHQGSGYQTWLGGLITCPADPVTTPWDDPTPGWDWHSQYGINVQIGGMKIIGTQFENLGDAVSFSGLPGMNPWSIYDCRFNLIHDDAIQNDNLMGGTISCCFIEGTHVFFSNQESTLDGTANTITIENTLVRLVGYYNSYNPPSYGYYQHGGFWKEWKPHLSPKLIVRNCIFRADQPAPYGGPVRTTGTMGTQGGLSAPDPTVVLEMEDVLLINTGSWGANKVETWQEVATGIRYGDASHWDYHANLWEPGYIPDLDAVP